MPDEADQGSSEQQPTEGPFVPGEPAPGQSGPGDIMPAGAVAAASPRPANGGRRAHVLLAAALAVALVGAGTGASLALAGSGSGGAGTPAGAVTSLVSSLGNVDVIGMLDSLDPGERNAIEPGLESIFAQLKRLGVLSADADLNHISGLSDSLQGYSTTTKQLTPYLAAVTVSGGTSTGSINPRELPLGNYFESLVDVAMNNQPATSHEPNNSPTVLGTVQVGGRWYVSIGYTAAINILQSEGKSATPPDAALALEPTGAASPEGAVEALFGSVSHLDLQALLADLDPGEMGAVDAYANDWLPQAGSALARYQKEVSINFGNLNFSTQPVPGGTLVQIGKGLTVDGQIFGAGFSYANGCVTVTLQSGRTTHQCYDPQQSLSRLLALLPPAVQGIFEHIIKSPPADGIVTVEENGRWYASPTRTVLQALSAFLAEFQPSDVQAIIGNASGIGAAFQGLLKAEVRSGLPGASLPL